MLPTAPSTQDDNHPAWVKYIVFGGLFCIAVLQVLMALRSSVHWDEFFLLDWVYRWNSGDLDITLQTIYLRAFSWIPRVSDNEVTQIIAARFVMLGCLGLTSVFIYRLCRMFTTQACAALSLILFLTMSFVFTNVSNFRMDMIATTSLMAVLWLVFASELTWKRVFLSGLFLGFAGMVTIKAIFYVPIIAVILLSHWATSSWDRSVFFKCLTVGVLSMVSFALLYVLHGLTINGASSTVDYVSHAATGSLLEAGLFPRRDEMWFGIVSNPLIFIFLALGVVLSGIQIARNQDRWTYVAAMSFAFPILTLIFYRHGYPYFYTFMLAPATVLIAIGLNAPFLKKSPTILLGCLALAAITTAPLAVRSLDQNLDTQHYVLDEIHALFPTPTPYIDRCAMVSSFPKSGLFMSHWMMGDYYDANKPIMPDILTHQQPKFILANIDSLNLTQISKETGRRLLPQDEALLKKNYIPHWGPIYVAGKTLELKTATPQSFQIFIAGPYAVESRVPVQINGRIYSNADMVDLAQGQHSLSPVTSTANPETITLRWNALPIPDRAPPKEKLF